MNTKNVQQFTSTVKPAEDPYRSKPVNINQIPQTITPSKVTNLPAPGKSIGETTKIQPDNPNLCRSVSYVADFAGCGHYRMLWPNWCLNATYSSAKNGKPAFSINNSAAMIFEANVFYDQMKTVRVQRQATKQQMEFLKHFLVPISKKKNFKIAYDADDWFFDIPTFNHAYKAYNPDILNNIAEIVTNMDYMTVTTSHLRNLFHEKIKIPKERILIIPNYLPKFLYDGYYDKEVMKAKCKQKMSDKPRILWTGSSTHFNLGNMTDKDDVKILRQFIHKTAKKYQWVMVGIPKDAVKYLGLPPNVECHPWCAILNYPHLLHSVKCDLAVTSLYNCDFNKAKSNIKLLEFGALGIPAVLEDIEPYKKSPCKFSNFDELEQQVDRLIKDGKFRYNVIAQQRNFVERSFWLEDNLDQWCDLYQGKFEKLQAMTENEMTKLV